MPPSRIVSLSKLAFQGGFPWHNWNNKEKVLLHYRVVILGSARVGKTSIVRRLLSDDTFVEAHVPTIEEMYQLEMRGADATLLLDLLDTSGSYPFPAMRDLAIRSADAFLLVYAVDDQNSYDEVIRLKDLIYELRGQNGVPPVVVVANKTDLAEKRVIDTNLTDSVISIDWEFGHVECSAKKNENISRIFTQLARQKIQIERQLEKANDSESDGSEPEISPSRSSISSADKLFFAEDFSSFHGSCNSLDIDSRKSSISDSELEFRLRNGFKSSNCIIS